MTFMDDLLSVFVAPVTATNYRFRPTTKKKKKNIAPLTPSVMAKLNERKEFRVQRIQGVVAVRGVSLMSVDE